MFPFKGINFCEDRLEFTCLKIACLTRAALLASREAHQISSKKKKKFLEGVKTALDNAEPTDVVTLSLYLRAAAGPND